MVLAGVFILAVAIGIATAYPSHAYQTGDAELYRPHVLHDGRFLRSSSLPLRVERWWGLRLGTLGAGMEVIAGLCLATATVSSKRDGSAITPGNKVGVSAHEVSLRARFASSARYWRTKCPLTTREHEFAPTMLVHHSLSGIECTRCGRLLGAVAGWVGNHDASTPPRAARPADLSIRIAWSEVDDRRPRVLTVLVVRVVQEFGRDRRGQAGRLNSRHEARNLTTRNELDGQDDQRDDNPAQAARRARLRG